MQILSESQERILKDERRILNELRVELIKFDIENSDSQALAESISQLDELFLLVVVGEFNSGKSAFINALLGDRFLLEGVTPTTTQINILRYGKEVEKSLVKENQLLQSFPIDWLAEISIVDTPGTNAIIRSHEAITSEFIPRSDLVLFVTSVDRPFTESERSFLERIRDWGKKVVIVINKIDNLQDEQELKQIIDFVASNARTLLGLEPEIFPISARQALRAKQGESDLWISSRFDLLENFIRNALDEESRLRLKLLNPLGVGLHLSEKYINIVAKRLEMLKDDTQMLDDVDRQLSIYAEDMQRDFSYRIADIENLLYELDKRGQDFFEENFRLARVMDLLSKDRIRTAFTERVISNIPQQIEKKIFDLIDWLVDSDLRQWQAVNEHLAERRRAYQNRIVGDLGQSKFSYDRDRLIDAVGREAQRIIETYDKEAEAKAIADGAQEAVAASAVLEAGAIGLGTLITVLATTAAADVTGIIMATFIAALGLVIIPARRRSAKNQMNRKMIELRQQLSSTLGSQFQKEIERSIQNIQNAISPYTRFVRSEHNKLNEMQTTLKNLQLEMNRLKDNIGSGTGR
jgi:small GTP-binding protein